MAYNPDTSIHGRRLGLQKLSTSASGGSHGTNEFLVGPDAYRDIVTTNDTTSSNLKAFGVHLLPNSSVGSSQVFTLDPPIPGVSVTIANTTAASALVKTANSETILLASQGSTNTVLLMSSAGHAVTLIGLSTARWGSLSYPTSAEVNGQSST